MEKENIEEKVKKEEEDKEVDEEKKEKADEEELEDEEGFGDMSLSLGTYTQNTNLRKQKNLENTLKGEEEAAEVIPEKDYQDYQEAGLRDEEEEREEGPYETNPADVYNLREDEEEKEKRPYSTEREQVYGTMNDLYTAPNGNGGGAPYDPRQQTDNPMEKDWVKGVRFNSGLEQKSRKARMPTMNETRKKQETGNPLYDERKG
jgi:hypothetical protein